MKVEETMKLTNLMAWTAAALVVLSGGCQNENQSGFFKGEAAREEVDKFTDVQVSNGARNDGQLYAYHFTGGHLNGLGRAKVIAMLENCDDCDPVIVHLVNVGQGDVLNQRKASVELYLKTADGPNKVTFHPAADDLVRFSKTESGEIPEAGAAGADTGSAGAPAK